MTDFYRTIRAERRRVSLREATDEIRVNLESLNRLIFGEGRVRPDHDPNENRVVSAQRLMPIRRQLSLILRALQEVRNDSAVGLPTLYTLSEAALSSRIGSVLAGRLNITTKVGGSLTPAGRGGDGIQKRVLISCAAAGGCR